MRMCYGCGEVGSRPCKESTCLYDYVPPGEYCSFNTPPEKWGTKDDPIHMAEVQRKNSKLDAWCE